MVDGALEEAAGEVWGGLQGREDRQSQSQSQPAVPGLVRSLAGWGGCHGMVGEGWTVQYVCGEGFWV